MGAVASTPGLSPPLSSPDVESPVKTPYTPIAMDNSKSHRRSASTASSDPASLEITPAKSEIMAVSTAPAAPQKRRPAATPAYYVPSVTGSKRQRNGTLQHHEAARDSDDDNPSCVSSDSLLSSSPLLDASATVYAGPEIQTARMAAVIEEAVSASKPRVSPVKADLNLDVIDEIPVLVQQRKQELAEATETMENATQLNLKSRQDLSSVWQGLQSLSVFLGNRKAQVEAAMAAMQAACPSDMLSTELLPEYEDTVIKIALPSIPFETVEGVSRRVTNGWQTAATFAKAADKQLQQARSRLLDAEERNKELDTVHAEEMQLQALLKALQSKKQGLAAWVQPHKAKDVAV